MNKQNDSDWFKLSCDKTGTKYLLEIKWKYVDGMEFAGFTTSVFDTSSKSSLRFPFGMNRYVAPCNISDESTRDQATGVGWKDAENVSWREDLL